jgi:hypothetical protein
MTLRIELDQDAAAALATVLHHVGPTANGGDEDAWYRAVYAVLPQLPASATDPTRTAPLAPEG